jgi:hypothetical protein
VLDGSSGTPLEARAGTREAVEPVESGDAQVIVAACFDRLFRSLGAQSVMPRRVEAAGGKVLALDIGEVSNGSAGDWLNATMRGSRHQRHSTRARHTRRTPGPQPDRPHPLQTRNATEASAGRALMPRAQPAGCGAGLVGSGTTGQRT